MFVPFYDLFVVCYSGVDSISVILLDGLPFWEFIFLTVCLSVG